jgi:hypothetical protein
MKQENNRKRSVTQPNVALSPAPERFKGFSKFHESLSLA